MIIIVLKYIKVRFLNFRNISLYINFDFQNFSNFGEKKYRFDKCKKDRYKSLNQRVMTRNLITHLFCYMLFWIISKTITRDGHQLWHDNWIE